MSEPIPDVIVKVEGGVAEVTVFRKDIVVEVRDFDVDGANEKDEFMWRNEEGDLCWRYFVEKDEETQS